MRNKLDLFEEEARRATYKNWIFSNNQTCSADKMAEAGFIFIGSSKEPDLAQCFFCGKSLDCWDATDDPWKEHLKHTSDCDFAKTQKPQDLWTLDEWLDVVEKYQKSLIVNSYKEVEKQLEKVFDSIKELVTDS